MLGREQLAQVAGGGAVAARVEHPREQLLGGLLGLDVEQLLLLAAQHQPRLQLQQRGDQHDELGRRLEVELAALLEVVEVGEHDVGERQLEQVDLFAQDERQQQVERAAEDVEVELERGEAHGRHRTVPVPTGSAPSAADAHPLAHVGERLGGDRARAARRRRRGSPRAPASSPRSAS